MAGCIQIVFGRGRRGCALADDVTVCELADVGCALADDVTVCELADVICSEEQREGSALADVGCLEADVNEIASGGEVRVNSSRKSVNASDSLPTIYRVPQRIRPGNKDAIDPYKPQILSIGPYHHDEESLKDMENIKQQYQHAILSRNDNFPLEKCLENIKELEDQVRSCYSHNVPQNGFVEMMVLDGCFIVELFLKRKEQKQSENMKKSEDPIFRTIWMLSLIRYDMLLLENQIPYFVLQRIYKMASPPGNNNSLEELALDFFEPIMPRVKETQIKNSDRKDPYLHLLDFFHRHLIHTPIKKSNMCKKLLVFLRSKGFLPSSKKDQLPISDMDPVTMMIPCASDLQLAGVKLKKKKEFSSILDVEFSQGVLKIPPLLIEDYTNTLFRNLVAFEQCCYPRATIHFTTYLRFMDCLVNTSEDVALLHRNGIIDHLLGSDEDVAHLFNQLCYGTFNSKKNYLSDLFKDVDEYYNTQWNMWWASFRRDYCINPCTCLTSLAAVILIAVTILQTFYTIYPYYRPRS